MKKDNMDKLKVGAVLVLLVAALAFVDIFFPPVLEWKPGTEVNGQTFTHVLEGENRVNILTDIRGTEAGSPTRWGILQCGVDFAGSYGLATKSVRYLAIDDEGCVAEDGRHDLSYCFEVLEEGVTLYVHKDNETTFHSNAMMVGIGDQYRVGICNIERVS